MKSESAMKKTILSALLFLSFLILSQQATYSEDPPASIQVEQVESQSHGTPLLKQVNAVVYQLLLFDVAGGAIRVDKTDRFGNIVRDAQGVAQTKQVSIPFLVAVLLIGELFFTFWFGFTCPSCGKYEA